MSNLSNIEQRVYPCIAVVEPGENVPGSWVAHCLTFDVVAQADDPEVALRLVFESTCHTVVDDLNGGDDPEERRAPVEDWHLLAEATDHGRPISLDQAKATPVTDDGRVAILVASFMVSVHRALKHHEDAAPIGMIGMHAVTVEPPQPCA